MSGKRISPPNARAKCLAAEKLRDKRDRFLALCRRLASNGIRSARPKLRQLSSRKMGPRLAHDRETDRAIVQASVEKGRQGRDGPPHADPRPVEGRAGICRPSSSARQARPASRSSISIQPPPVRPLRAVEVWETLGTSFRVSLLSSPAAQRRQRKSEDCPDGQGRGFAKDDRKQVSCWERGEGEPSLRSTRKPATFSRGLFTCRRRATGEFCPRGQECVEPRAQSHPSEDAAKSSCSSASGVSSIGLIPGGRLSQRTRTR